MKKNISDKIITFKPFSNWLKIFNFILACLILGSNIAGIKTNSYSLIGIFIGCVCMSASGYKNSWAFNLTQKNIINKKGFLFLLKKTTFKFSEIENIIVNKFIRSGRKTEYTEISLQLKDGSIKIIESDKTKRLKETIKSAEEIQNAITDFKAGDSFI